MNYCKQTVCFPRELRLKRERISLNLFPLPENPRKQRQNKENEQPPNDSNCAVTVANEKPIIARKTTRSMVNGMNIEEKRKSEDIHRNKKVKIEISSKRHVTATQSNPAIERKKTV